MKILILTIATNKYIQFVERLYDNIADNFLNGHEIQGLLFTEHDVETSDNIKVSQIEHEDWPMPTLKRYNYFIILYFISRINRPCVRNVLAIGLC